MSEVDVKKKLDAIHQLVTLLKDFTAEDITDIVAFALKHLGKEDVVTEITKDTSHLPAAGVRGKLTIDAFVGQKAPKNEYQKVAVLAYYLMKNTGADILTARDLSDANANARQPRFSNLSTVINRAVTRYRYLTIVKRGEYRLSYDAEQMVEALPDQAEAQRITQTRKPAAKQNKKKKTSE